jgi:SlyX protein
MNDKIVDLESRLAYQEHTLDTLNKVVIEQQKEIAQLNHFIRILKDKIKDVEENGGANQANERPPHY